MTLGTGSFVPNARFSFPRSYIHQLVINVDTNSISQADGHVVFGDPGNPNVHFHIVVDPRFWEWSSNKWTMDYVIEQSYYVVDPSPTELPMPFTLAFRQLLRNINALVFQPFSINFVDYHTFEYPPPPSGYWLPSDPG